MSLANPLDPERPSGWASATRWTTAALAVATAHAAAAWFFVHMPPVATPPAGAPEAPILIELAPPEPAPSAPAVDAPEPQVEPEPTPPEPEPMPEPEPVTPPEPVIPPPPEPEPLPEPEPIEEPEPEPLPEPPPVPAPELPVVETPAEAVINAPVPRPRPPAPRREVAEKPRVRETPPKRVERKQPERPRVERRQAAPPPSQASKAAQSTQGARTASKASIASWRSQVQARLNRFKRSPRGGGVGIARVSFTITSSGAATGISLARSSGNPVLDEAALSLIRRASPFPPPPEGNSVPIRGLGIDFTQRGR